MKTVSSETIHERLTGFGLNYPAAMIGPAQVLILLDDWREDLGHLTERQFLSAVTEYRRSNKFFPCTADILEAYAAVAARVPRSKLVAISQHGSSITDEQKDRNIEGCQKIREIISRAAANKKVSAA